VGGFSLLKAGGSGTYTDITTNGSDFWIVETGGDFVYHINAFGNNITDRFSLKSASPSISPTGIDTNRNFLNPGNPNDFWIGASTPDFIFHFLGVVKETSSPTSHTIQTNLSDLNSYYWRVKAFDGGSESGFSYANFSIDTTPPTEPETTQENICRTGLLGVSNIAIQLPLLATILIFAMIIGSLVFKKNHELSGKEIGGYIALILVISIVATITQSVAC